MSKVHDPVPEAFEWLTGVVLLLGACALTAGVVVTSAGLAHGPALAISGAVLTVGAAVALVYQGSRRWRRP